MFLFCKPAYSRKRFLPHRALDKSYNFSLFENASEVPAQDWEKVVGTSHLFFNLAYLLFVWSHCSGSLVWRSIEH